MKNSLLPRIKKLCVSTTLLSVRVNSLICLGKLLTHLDKWLVIDEVLPLMQQIPSREPAVIMGIVGEWGQTLSFEMTIPVFLSKTASLIAEQTADNCITPRSQLWYKEVTAAKPLKNDIIALSLTFIF